MPRRDVLFERVIDDHYRARLSEGSTACTVVAGKSEQVLNQAGTPSPASSDESSGRVSIAISG